MKKGILAVAAASMMLAGAAQATIVTVFDSFNGGLTNFNNTVAGTGGTASHDNWATLASGTTVDRGDYTIKRNNGGNISSAGVYRLSSASIATYTSGQTVDISPSSPTNTRGIGAIGSGLTLTFDNPVNAIGFEVGDWGTCCSPSGLYISFNDGAPILVGMYDGTNAASVRLTNNGYGVFVGAFDDSATFTKVQFWGDGFGEYLVMGGTIHYANIGTGTLPSVPEPGSLALIGLGLLGFAGLRRKQAA